MKILYNDWPYGVEEGIIHLVVWVKFELEDDPATDDLTPRARKEIDDYVKKTFCSRVPPERVIEFLHHNGFRMLIGLLCRSSGLRTGNPLSQSMRSSISMSCSTSRTWGLCGRSHRGTCH